ncbi:hypothetical protein ACFLS1_12560, partial [Verrucomicrobiota bacterium]
GNVIDDAKSKFLSVNKKSCMPGNLAKNAYFLRGFPKRHYDGMGCPRRSAPQVQVRRTEPTGIGESNLAKTQFSQV